MTGILRQAHAAGAQSGRPALAQLFDLARLRAGRHAILPSEYFSYRLFDPALSPAARREYVGAWAKDRVYRIQDPAAVAIGRDKLRSYRLFAAYGLPFPRLLAAVHPENDFPGAASLRGAADIAAWLGEAPLPFFAKAAVGYRGYGSRLVAGLDRAAGALVFGDGSRQGLDSFAAWLGAPGAPTMLFQEAIRPHPELARLVGERAATLRLMVLNDGAEPEIFRGGFRIPAGRSMVDNFRGGESGNLLGCIDLETGRLLEVLGGVGLAHRTVAAHPDTGTGFAEFQLPDWDAAIRLVKAASRAMPGLPLHFWDVAFTGAGPMLLETNPRGDFGIPQLTARRGLAEPRFLRLYPNGRI